MPGIVRKLILYATIDGLVLQPLGSKGQRHPQPVTIDYKTASVRPLLRGTPTEEHDKETQLECYGVIGLLKVSTFAYLITVSKRQQVAQIFGKPVYVITGVSVIPLGSQAEAQQAINHTKKTLKKSKDKPDEGDDDYGADSDSDTSSLNDGTVGDDHSVESTKDVPESRGRPSVDLGEFGIAQNVIEKKGNYGRFADRWFSKKGWTTGSRRNLGMSGGESGMELEEKKGTLDPISEAAEASKADGEEDRVTAEAVQGWPQTSNITEKQEEDLTSTEQDKLTTSLIPKLVQTTKLLLSSRIFYFSYEQDLTTSSKNGGLKKSSSDIALLKQANPEYFWNAHLASPFIEAGFTEFIFPIMQGFVGQREFTVKAAESTKETLAKDDAATDVSQPADTASPTPHDQPFLITIISRRSLKRSGLRYLRRGIDEDGNVANAVETEQILSTPEWDTEIGTQSFVQCRGSIPLFFSQIPYSFKPVPALHGTPEANQKAIQKHYASLTSQYGEVHTVSLVDRHGTEPKVGQGFEDNVKQLNETGGVNGKKMSFNWWEFHHICRGMKFENVQQLVDETSDYLASSSWTSANQTQSGIIRTNCMDCLDRTNVVQSAFGQHILEAQLAALRHPLSLAANPTSHSWFNTLWADNGDAISRSYTGTSALKGDYTRTRKRNVIGALTDFSLTLSRYYQNLFEDFFAQAAIDYLLGGVDESVFAEFEATMTTADPSVDLRRARQSAIDMAAGVVLEPNEDLHAGWALASPHIPNTLRTWPFEETLLLLTAKAAYVTRFDWATEKVRSFDRIALDRIAGLHWGAYVTETHTRAQTDTKRNVGFVVRYRVEDGDEGVKVFTRSLDTAAEEPASEPTESSQIETDSQAGNKAEEAAAAAAADETTSPVDDKKETTGKTLDTPTKKKDTAKAANKNKDTQDKKAQTFKSADTPSSSEIRFYAFKALPSRSSAVKLKPGESVPPNEQDIVKQICNDIGRAVAIVKSQSKSDAGDMTSQGAQVAIPAESKDAAMKKEQASLFELVEGDILSLDDARKSTGYLETIGYSLKKLVWG